MPYLHELRPLRAFSKVVLARYSRISFYSFLGVKRTLLRKEELLKKIFVEEKQHAEGELGTRRKKLFSRICLILACHGNCFWKDAQVICHSIIVSQSFLNPFVTKVGHM